MLFTMHARAGACMRARAQAVCTAHIACECVILEFLAIGTKVAVALDKGAFVNAPGAAEAVHKVNDIAGADGAVNEGVPSSGMTVARPDTIRTRSEA